MQITTIEMAGSKFHRENFLAAKVVKNDQLQLEAEPTNPYDHAAVKVLKAGKHIGYIPRMFSSAVSKALADGEQISVIVVAAWPLGCSLTIAIKEEESSADK